jgi:Holliday junction resolvase RusA-like endonuclease
MPSKKSKDWEKDAIGQLRRQVLPRAVPGLPTFWSDVTVNAQIYRARDTGDIHNFFQAIGDALQGGGGRRNRVPCVLADDSQIKSWDGSRLRLDRKNPRVELTIEPMEDEG